MSKIDSVFVTHVVTYISSSLVMIVHLCYDFRRALTNDICLIKGF